MYKKAFQSNANRPIIDSTFFIVNKFEYFWGRRWGQSGGPVVGKPRALNTGVGGWGQDLVQRGNQVPVQNGWLGPYAGTLLWTDRRDWKHYLLITSLAGGNVFAPICHSVHKWGGEVSIHKGSLSRGFPWQSEREGSERAIRIVLECILVSRVSVSVTLLDLFKLVQ